MPRRVAIGTLTIFVDDDQPTFWDRVEANGWEPGTLALLSEWVNAGTEFLDLGAWVGPLTLYAAALGAQVTAVEADPRALDQLRRNLAANPDLASRVRVVPRAVSARAGPVRMGTRRKPGDSMSSALLADAHSTWLSQAVTPVELAGMLSGTRRRLVKIDIEGGEYTVLPALGPVLEGTDVALLLALHPDILGETGAADVASLTDDALVLLRGWTISKVGPTGAVSSSFADMRAGALLPGEWFLRKPGSAA